MPPEKAFQSAPKFPWNLSYPVDIEWNSEIPSKTMVQLFEESAKKFNTRPCLDFFGKKLTYGEVADMVDHFAKGLQDQGIGKGSKVGLCLPNSPFYVISYYAALKTGATVVNFNPLYAEKEIEHQIKDSDTDLMVTLNLKQIFPKVERMRGNSTLKKIVVCDFPGALPAKEKIGIRVINKICDMAASKPLSMLLGKKRVAKLLSWRDKKGIPAVSKIKKDKSLLSFDKLVRTKGSAKPVDVQPDDLAVLQYTGGTTGVPKAAMLSHGNLATNTQQAALWFALDGDKKPNEKMLVILPFFHVFSMTAQLNLGLHTGAELVLLPKFELKNLLETISATKPTMFAAVPTIYKAIIDCKTTGKYDLSSLKTCVSGGAPLPEETMKGFKKLTGLELIEGYGLSETSPLATANPVAGEKKLNSIGMPVPLTEVKISDLQFPDKSVPLILEGEFCLHLPPETVKAIERKYESLQLRYKDVPMKAEGEICLRGPQLMQGYWKRPDETEKVMDKEGYFHTGDVGYIDGDGYLFIVDRIKDMIIVNGMKAFPRKIEDAIMKHEAVSEVIVVGVKDDLRGETVKAYVVLKEGQTLAASALKEFLKDHLTGYEMPKQIEYRDSLPKTMIGKPDKKALKAEEAAKQKPAAPKPPKVG